jgi:serine/threonine-protein kinase RsbW
MNAPADDLRGGVPAAAHFSERYPAVARTPAQARAALVAFARAHGASQQVVAALALAVSEAVTNVVVHAYRDAPAAGIVQVSADVADSELHVTIADRGAGLRAAATSPGLGLGLAIIAQSADGIDLKRTPGGGLELSMRFSI